MNTLHLQLNKKVAALSAEHPFEYATLRYLAIFVCALILVYLYLVSMSVLNVIAQKEADQRSASLESRLGELESKYFALNEELTLERAAALGLTPISDSSYVYRQKTVGLIPAPNAI